MSKVNFPKKFGKERDRMCLLKQKSSFFIFSYLIAVLFFSICSQCSTTKHFVYFRNTSYLKIHFLHNNEYVSLVKVTSLNSKWTNNGAFQRKKSRHFKTDQKHLSGRLLKAFCYQLYTLPWCCYHLQNIKLLRFILISLPSEIGIYVEEMGEQTVFRKSRCVLINLLLMG